MSNEESSQTVSVTFGVKLATGNYENEDLRVSITQAVPDSFTEEMLLEEAGELTRQVKAMTYKEAGVEYDLSEDGLVMRRLTKSVRTSDDSKAPVAKSAKPSGGYKKQTGGKRKVNAEAQALWVSLVESDNPRSDFYDNRGKIIAGDYKPTAPLFKHKKSSSPLFISDCPEDLKGYFVDSDNSPHFETVEDFA